MQHCRARCGLLLALLTVLWPIEARAVDLPTADQILQIHRQNRERLSRLHLQLVHRLETTEACCRANQDEARRLEDLVEELTGIEQGSIMPSWRAIESMREKATELRRRSEPRSVLRPMEIFLNNKDHQYRQPYRLFLNEVLQARWEFAEAPVTAETLRSQHRELIVFSRSSRDGHAAQWWRPDAHGCAAPGRLDQIVNVSLPPFASALSSNWCRMHPYDLFFSQEPSAYRVVRVEELDGQALIVVDTTIRVGDRRGDILDCRAWLDLKRGAFPVKMYSARWSEGSEKVHALVFDRFPPTDVIITREIRALENGAHYPTRTTFERFKLDPGVPELSGEEILEIAEGNRQLPLAVFYRETWTCTRVEIKTDYPANFFELPLARQSEIDVY